jgi:iron complex transport system ATP-binding protein
LNSKTKHIVLQTENLSIGYQQKKSKTIIADTINLSLEKGKFIALLGKNGIGKSTLLRTISKVQNPLSGEVFINRKNLNSYTNKELATNLSLVLTERLPESQLTVYELIALGRQPYTNWVDRIADEDANKINWAIQKTEIKHLQEKRFYELSDGQLQRVLIARALAQDTEIIILDEPTAHLDMHHTYKIFQLLKKLVDSTSKTIIISTHQVNLALEIVDELIIMNGKEILNGTTQELIETNKLDDLFPKEILNFNKKLRQFTIRKDN